MKYWQVICASILLLTVLINTKTRLWSIFKAQFEIYKNDKTRKFHWVDLASFIGIPIIIGVIVGLNMPLSKITANAGTIITIFSLIVTLPLSFLALLIDKILKTQDEKDVAKETFAAITADIIYTLLIIALIVFSELTSFSDVTQKIIVGVISYFVVKMILNIFMIFKRVFRVWEC